jgi:hypothetical protein
LKNGCLPCLPPLSTSLSYQRSPSFSLWCHLSKQQPSASPFLALCGVLHVCCMRWARNVKYYCFFKHCIAVDVEGKFKMPFHGSWLDMFWMHQCLKRE